MIRKRTSEKLHDVEPHDLGPAYKSISNSNTLISERQNTSTSERQNTSIGEAQNTSIGETHYSTNEMSHQEIISLTEKEIPDVCPERYFNADCGSGTCFKGESDEVVTAEFQSSLGQW